MTEITILKMEARKLLDEVNQYSERSSNEAGIFTLHNEFENIFEKSSNEFSFKERLKKLKQKIHELSYKNISAK